MPLVVEKLARNGITSILDAYTESYLLDYYLWLAEQGGMTFRARLSLHGDLENSLDMGAEKQVPALVKQLKNMREKVRNYPYMKADGVKLLVDGVLEGDPYTMPPTLPVAALLGEYKQPVFSFDPQTDKLELVSYVDLDSAVCQSVRGVGPAGAGQPSIVSSWSFRSAMSARSGGSDR